MKNSYRAEIDGLRALAVIPVIFFHANFDFFSGGYIGVDIFFVISGYLITTIILNEIHNNTFTFSNFYERRVRRIFPALFLVIFVTSLLTFIFLTRSEIFNYYRSVISTVFFYSNYFFWETQPYFAADSSLEPLIHTWSLSIEEQFYIFFPIILILMCKYLKEKILIILSVGFFFSLLGGHLLTHKYFFDLSFYFTLSRGWELGVGVIAAYIIFNNNFSIFSKYNNSMSILGLFLIIFSFYFFQTNNIIFNWIDNFFTEKMRQNSNYNLFFPTRDIYLLIPTIGTVLIILFANKKSVVTKLLSNKLLVLVGLMSFSLYLWHQPLFALSKRYSDSFTLELKIILIICSFILSYLSWNYVEKIFRNKKIIHKNFLLKIVLVSYILFISLSYFSIVSFNNNSINGTEASLVKSLNYKKSVYQPKIDKRSFQNFRIKLSNQNPSEIVVGSSRIAFINEEMLNNNSLTFAVDTATFEDIIVYSMMAIEKFEINRIFISADPWLFNSNKFLPYSDRWKINEEYYKYATGKIINQDFENKILRINKKNNIFLLKLSNLFNYIYKKINLRQNKLDPEITNANKHIIYADGSEKYQTDSMKVNGNEFKRFTVPYKKSDEKIKLFTQFKNFLEKNNIELIMLLIPIYEDSLIATNMWKNNLITNIENDMIDLAKKTNTKLFGSYDPRNVKCKKSDFYDDDHPNELCIKKIMNDVNS